MRTIKYLLAILILLPINIKAKTYYSSYNEFSDYQEESIEKTDLVYVEKHKFYQAYKDFLSYESEDTLKEKTGNIKYENEEWVKEKPEKFIEEKEFYLIKKYAKGRALRFYNNGSDYCDIKLNLKEKEPLTIRINKKSYYDLIIEDKQDIKDFLSYEIRSPYPELNYKIEFISVLENQTVISKIFRTNYEKVQLNISEKYESQEISENMLNDNDEKITMYKTADILYEVKEKKYENIFLKEEVDDYKIDKKIFIERYRYKIRNKIETPDIFVIEDYITKIEDKIKATTEFKITSDINYYKNGEYTLNIITPFRVITEKIVVDNKENYINLIKEQQKVIEEVTNNMEVVNYKIEKKNQEIKEIVNNSEDKFLATEVEKLKTALKEVENKKETLENVEVKEMSNVIFVVIITFLMIISLSCRKKSIEKSI